MEDPTTIIIQGEICNILRVLDSKNPRMQDIVKVAKHLYLIECLVKREEPRRFPDKIDLVRLNKYIRRAVEEFNPTRR